LTILLSAATADRAIREKRIVRTAYFPRRPQAGIALRNKNKEGNTANANSIAHRQILRIGANAAANAGYREIY
jgi:hypothetical protein